MIKETVKPDYIFESSWEVCNKVGGIYTVLSTRANTLQKDFKDKIIFIGPDFWREKSNPLFIEDKNIYASWREQAVNTDGLNIRIGRWNIPGKPIVFLVDFTPFFAHKNDFYTDMWLNFEVDSLHAYGDYDEASMFSIAAAKVVESFYNYYLSDDDKVIYQAHEWMTGMGALYLRKAVPQIATIFTTHATSIGRSIAGNQKPLYDYLDAYNGDQMAQELNMQSKHSIEKQTAHNVDCFTTVSEITNRECTELLDKPADVILMNGFENGFVPKGKNFDAKRKEARKVLLHTANALMGSNWGDDTIIVGTSGRYEFKNKGIDVYIEALNRLNKDKNLNRNILAFINVPAWKIGPRNDLQERLESGKTFDTPLYDAFITHWLHNVTGDQIVNMLRNTGLTNEGDSKVKVIFVPCYFDGNDGIVNKTYYDTVLGEDISVYASYYEPWGYTPLESVAFRVPTITTDLTGFGLWVNGLKDVNGIDDGVEVLHRSDYNFNEVADGIKDTLLAFSSKSADELANIRTKATAVAEKALWKHFIKYYYKAYDVALQNMMHRLKRDIK
jgi:glycosyltransferase involved in cell wall biosynthesis